MNNLALITGGLGFIGKNFCNFIASRYEKILIVDKVTRESDLYFYKKILAIKCDLIECKVSEFDLSGIECDLIDVFHFAADSHVDDSFSSSLSFSKNNYLETHFLIEGLIKSEKNYRLLYVSTDEVYGDSGYDYADEATLLSPTNPYAASKAAADLLVQTYIRCYNINAKIIRPNNVFGPFQHRDKLIPKLFFCAEHSETFFVHNGGKMKRSFLHTEDFNHAMVTILKNWHCKEKIYNIGSREEFSVLQVIDIIEKITKKRIKINNEGVKDRPYNDKSYRVDCSALRSLGWTADREFLTELYLLQRNNQTYFG